MEKKDKLSIFKVGASAAFDVAITLASLIWSIVYIFGSLAALMLLYKLYPEMFVTLAKPLMMILLLLIRLIVLFVAASAVLLILYYMFKHIFMPIIEKQKALREKHRLEFIQTIKEAVKGRTNHGR